jgi:hypothetical protein
MQSDAFVDSIGINTHLVQDLQQYGTGAVITKRMQELRIRHVRDEIYALTQAQYDDEKTFLAVTSSKMDAITDCPKPLGYTVGAQTPPYLIREFNEKIGGAVELVEAPNEPDLRGVEDWPSLLVSCITKLNLNHALPVPFVAPAMGLGYHASELGNISSLVDIGAIHSYFDGSYNPGFPGIPQHNGCGHYWSLPWEECEARINSGGQKPLYVTETGYTAPTSMDETSAAKYVGRVLFVDNIDGIRRTYLYELQDDGADATNPEDGFGLVRHDGSPKPAFWTVRSIIDQLIDPGPAFATTPLTYALLANSYVDHELFQKRDGTYVLVLWEEVQSWDVDQQRPTYFPPRPVTIALPSAPATASAQRIDDAGQLERQQLTPSGNRITVQVDDHLTFVTFRFATAAL